MKVISRRDLLKGAGLAGAGLAASGRFSAAIAEYVTAASPPDLEPAAPSNRKTMRAVPFARHETVRVGIVGTGLRGTSVLTELLGVEGVTIAALCDVVSDKARRAAKMAAEKYVTGDMNTSILKTVNGKTVMLQHDVSNARPYTRHNRVMGTKGTFEDYPPRIYIEGTPGGERFGPIDDWKSKFEHPLWTKLGDKARGAGHGGVEYRIGVRIIICT